RIRCPVDRNAIFRRHDGGRNSSGPGLVGTRRASRFTIRPGLAAAKTGIWFMNSAVLSLLIAVAVHHSIAGVYDNSRQVTIEGVIAEFHFVNPHPFVIVDVNSERWKLEMDNLSELVEVGMTKETLKPGDRVVVSGSP